MCPVFPFPFRASTSGTQKHFCNLTQRGLVDKASWISQVPMKATWLPLNTLFHAPNTVWVSKTAHVLLILFCFPDIQANIKGIPLSSWCISWIPGYLPNLLFSWDWKSIGPSAPPEVALPSGFWKLGHVLLIQSELVVNLILQHKTQSWKGCLWKVGRHIFGVIFSSFYPHMPTRKSSVYYHLWNTYYIPDVLCSLSLILTRTTWKFYFPT